MELIYKNNRYEFPCEYKDRLVPQEAGFTWDSKKKVWHTSDRGIASSLASYSQDTVLIESLRSYLKGTAADINESYAVSSNFKVPVNPGLEYLPFQRAGIEYGYKRNSVLIADQMGLGKTIQALGIINMHQDMSKILIVVPASLKLNWKREAEKWLVRKYSVSVVMPKDKFPDSNIVIINYDIVKRYKEILKTKWDMIILDEAHYIKNADALRTKFVRKIKAGKKLLLTGTPILNKPIELYSLLKYLDQKTWNSKVSYANRYCNRHIDENGYWDDSGASNLEELQRILRSSIMVRRMKVDVLKDLPAKVRQVIEIPRNLAAKQVDGELRDFQTYKDALRRLKARQLKGADEADYRDSVDKLRTAVNEAFSNMAKARIETARAKLPFVISHLKNIIASGEKVIVFAHHHEIVDALYAAFKEVAVVMTGRTPNAKRQPMVDAFQEDKSIRMFIGSIGAASVGITLTAASTLIFVELDWVPGILSQAEDRAHRIGQMYSVLVQHLVLEGSVDAQIIKTLLRKQRVIDKAMNNKVQVELPAVPVW